MLVGLRYLHGGAMAPAPIRIPKWAQSGTQGPAGAVLLEQDGAYIRHP